MDIQQYLVQVGLNNTRALLWDNLRSRRTAYVTNVIQGQANPNYFCLVYRPP